MIATMSLETSQKPTTPKPSILVIDDEAGPRDALKVILRPFFEIHSAESGQAAIDVLKHQPVDLITLDQKLPDRQGMDLLQEIKHDHADVEVIIITGYGSLRSAMEGIRYGAAGYLLKPFNVTELITLVNQTLEKKRRLDYLRRFIHTTARLWGSETDCAQAWQDMRAGYDAISTDGAGSPSTEKESELLPLLSDLLEAKDRRLLNHCSRVSFYATLLANRMSLTVKEQKSLALGAFLHDIGKIAEESYRVTDEEIFGTDANPEQSCHSELGAKLIAPLGLPAEVGQIIAYHHERWDGTGHPHGLKRDGIPILARIVSLAQTFDHLTAEFPDRNAYSINESCNFLSSHSGTHFDPTLTPLFCQVVQECKDSLPAMAIATNSTGRTPS